jgi:phosphate transport system substrate-binding protein
VSGQLKFTGPLLADIVLGKVKKWNDPAIVKLNPGVTLPAADLALVHRSDGSGTTFIFADYLGKVSPEFMKTVGVDASLKWPVGVGAKGNEGVSGMVQQTPGSVGYVELVYALQNKIPVGSVQNSTGAFVVPSESRLPTLRVPTLIRSPPSRGCCCMKILQTRRRPSS